MGYPENMETVEFLEDIMGDYDDSPTRVRIMGIVSEYENMNATIARLTAERDEARRERDELEQFIRHQGWDIKAARPSSEEGGG